MFISVDLPAPFSPSSAWTSPWRRSKLTSSLASTPGNRFVIPRSSSRGASATARSYPDGGRPLASSCAAALRPDGGSGRDPGVEPPDADRAAGRAEDEILAAVVDAVDGVTRRPGSQGRPAAGSPRAADPDGSAGGRPRSPRSAQRPPCAITIVAPRASAPSAASLHAAGRSARPGAQDDGAGDDVVDAADERRRERPLLRADPGDPRDGGALFRRRRARRPPRRGAPLRPRGRRARRGSAGAATSRRRRRPRSGRPGLPPRPRARARAARPPAATTTSGSPATCASVPCSITAPGTLHRERSRRRRCAGPPRRACVDVAAVVVVAAARFPSPQPPSAQASTSRAAAVRIPQRKQNGASLAARPVPDSTCEVGLT